MSVFQVVALLVIAVLAAVLLRGFRSGRTSAASTVLWLLLWIAAAAAIAWPETTAIVARRIGVRRGADLVFYVATLAAAIGFFWISVHLRKLSRQITLLVRELALTRAEAESQLLEDRR